MSIKVTKLTEQQTLGEAPHWDDRQQVLFFVDVLDQTIHKYVPTTRAHTRTKLDGAPGFILPVEGTTDQFLIGLEKKFVVVQWNGGEGTAVKIVREVGAVDQDTDNTKLNDGKADPRGRVFAGTMSGEKYVSSDTFPRHGTLYRADSSGVHKLDNKIAISNGLAWDLKRKAFYYTDTLERKIRRYDYDVETGAISNLRYIFDLDKNNIEREIGADGTTIDTDGNLWVAIFGGSCVLKIDPETGTILQTVPIPAPQVTSLTFGGPELDVLFVTTAAWGPSPPGAGSLYAVTGLGVKGLPNVSFKY